MLIHVRHVHNQAGDRLTVGAPFPFLVFWTCPKIRSAVGVVMATLRKPGYRRLSLLFHKASEPIFLIDAARRLVYVNPSWEALTGFEAESVLGQECLPLEPAAAEPGRDRLAASFCPPAEAFGTEPTTTTTLVIHASGEPRWRRLEFWPLHTGNDRPLAVLGFVRPVESTGSVPDAPSLKLRNQLQALSAQLRATNRPAELIGAGPQHLRLLEQIHAAAQLSGPVLIVGEPGTGKRMVARIIHEQGPSATRPLIALDAPAMTPDLLETALRDLLVADPATEGLPNAAVDSRPGTVLIREVCELPRDIQSQLETRPQTPTSPRLITTSKRDPDLARTSHKLRDDLYYQLTAQVIRLAPLRHRLQDLPLLAQTFLQQAPPGAGRKPLGFTAEAMEVLNAYDWPGNLSELRRVIEATMTIAAGDLITAADLPTAIKGQLGAAYNPPPMPPPVTPLDSTLETLERRLIEQALNHARHNKTKAADMLSISRPRLYRRMKELNIPDLPEPDEKAAGL